MSNTLVPISGMLAMAMRDVSRATKSEDEPFEITAEFTHPCAALTMMLDAFDAEFIQPAVDAANRRPLSSETKYLRNHRHSDLEAYLGSEEHGIVGRLIRFYDLTSDTMPVRIDIRVIDPARLNREITT